MSYDIKQKIVSRNFKLKDENSSLLFFIERLKILNRSMYLIIIIYQQSTYKVGTLLLIFSIRYTGVYLPI